MTPIKPWGFAVQQTMDAAASSRCCGAGQPGKGRDSAMDQFLGLIRTNSKRTVGTKSDRGRVQYFANARGQITGRVKEGRSLCEVSTET
jgi:hypothetical protein